METLTKAIRELLPPHFILWEVKVMPRPAADSPRVFVRYQRGEGGEMVQGYMQITLDEGDPD